jgi:hypothetical protein
MAAYHNGRSSSGCSNNVPTFAVRRSAVVGTTGSHEVMAASTVAAAGPSRPPPFLLPAAMAPSKFQL